MKTPHIIIVLLAVILFTNCKNNHKEINPIKNLIHSEVDSLLSYNEINAVSIGLIIGGKTYKVHKGELTKGLNNKPTDQTLYEIASLTKTFTGTLLAQAISENMVNIDDDIRESLDGDYPNLAFENNPITFRHLVTHRSRIPNMFPNKPEIFNNPDYDKLPYIINELQKDFSKEDFFNELRKVVIDTIPGSKFRYSNAGANLLGYCLENIYSKSFEALLKEKILSPLNMKNTKIVLSVGDKKNLAQGYNDKNMEMPFGTEKDMEAEGGIKSTLGDMMNYVAYHLDNKNRTVQESHHELLGLWDNFDNGMFWQMFINKEKPKKIFQNGGAFGTSSWITLIPEKNIGVFIITNQSGPKTHKRLNKTVENILAKLPITKE
jgi:CubicO group peptidase (beta-lactamase class C family)